MRTSHLVPGVKYYRVTLDKSFEDTYITELLFEMPCPSIDGNRGKDRWIFSNAALTGDSKYLLNVLDIATSLFVSYNSAVNYIRAEIQGEIDFLTLKLSEWQWRW